MCMERRESIIELNRRVTELEDIVIAMSRALLKNNVYTFEEIVSIYDEVKECTNDDSGKTTLDGELEIKH